MTNHNYLRGSINSNVYAVRRKRWGCVVSVLQEDKYDISLS